MIATVRSANRGEIALSNPNLESGIRNLGIKNQGESKRRFFIRKSLSK
jgi:hypothetical protein